MTDDSLDERALEWLRLLPADASFAVEGSPRLRTLLSQRLAPRPTAFVGWGLHRRQMPASGAYESMVLINTPWASVDQLRGLGFLNTLSFTALPSLADPRVFAPLDNRLAAASSLDFITLYRPVARLKRSLSILAARMGRLGQIGDRVLVARRHESGLERWLRETTGTPVIYLAISPGGISHKRKLTIQVTSAGGQVLGFAKLAAMAAAREAMDRECRWLDELAQHAALRARIPRVLARTMLAESLVTLLSPGPRGLAPHSFGAPHQEFLEILGATTGRRMPFEQSSMWRNLHEVLLRLESQLSAAWKARARATLERLRENLGSAPLPLRLAHRDFQAGNMRQGQHGKLFVYDWEGAQAESTPLYDFFNFNFLNSIRQGVPSTDAVATQLAAAQRWSPDSDERQLPAFLAAYLLDHALRRLTNSDVDRDARSVFVLETIADLLDRQGEWLGARG